jgi:ribonuclease D
MSHGKPSDVNDPSEPAKPRKPMYSRSMHRARSHESAHADDSLPETKIPQHPLIPRNAADLVATQDGLASLIAELRAAGRFAYDSEFIGELTYRPKLCLIQVSSAQRVSLIDPLVELDLSSFWELICDPTIEKIVHAGAQDVEPVVRHIGKSPANLFDTQIAAGFAGLSYPIALSRLVMEICGAKLGKGATFTHWDQRPLSAMQLRYAADDVRYLPAIHDAISKKLEARGHVDWNREECDAMCDASQYVFDPNSQYLRVRGASSLTAQGLAILRELTIWRDNSAREEDLPPRSLLKDEILLEMSRNPVRTRDKFKRVRGLPRPVEDRHGDAIIEATLRALALPPAQMPQQHHYEPSPSERFRAESVWAAAQAICTGQGIDPALATNRGEIVEFDRKLARKQPIEEHHVMQGWRRAALGQPLVDLCTGGKSFTMQWNEQGLRVKNQ